MAQVQNRRNRKRCYNAENGAMLFARLAPKRIIDLTNHPIIAQSLDPGSIFEIDGPIQSGKTSILMDIAARCILPKSAGGLEGNIAFIDCDGQFHIDRLISIMERILAENRSNPDEKEAKLEESLARFHYAACDSSQEFLQVFDSLDDAFVTVKIPENGAGWLVLIDTINAFYWLDRTSRNRTSVTQMQQNYAYRIRRFLAEHNVSAVVTKLIVDGGGESTEDCAKVDNDSGSPKLSASSVMDSNWRKLITSSVQLSVMEVGERTVHRAIGEKSGLNFEIGYDGISYIAL